MPSACYIVSQQINHKTKKLFFKNVYPPER